MVVQNSFWIARVAALWLGVCLIVLMVTGTPGTRYYDLDALRAGHITTGFWPPDQGEDRRLQWTKGDGLLRLHGYQPAGALIAGLQMTSIQAPGAVAAPLTIVRDEQPLLTMPVQPAWRAYHILTSPTTTRWQTPQLGLLSATTRVGSQDQRELGVALTGAWVTPIASRQLPPLFERAAFFATLVTLLFLTLQSRAKPVIAWGITLGACVLLIAASLLRPDDLAYIVPPLWHLLLIAVAGLGTLWLAQLLMARVGGSIRAVALGLLLGLAGQLLLRLQREDMWTNVLGGALLLGGGALAAAALPRLQSDPETPARESLGKWFQPWMLVVGCVVLALGLRLYQLGSVPFGMWRDEARHALLAIRILNDPTFRPVYVPDVPIQVDLPALLFYLQAIPIALLGPSVVAARLIPALAGSLTVISMYLLGRRLGGWRVGLVAALLLAVSSWHIALSRFASPAVLDPFFTLTGLVLLDRALTANESTGRRQLLLALAAGAIMALALYTYHTGRLMPLVAVALIAARLGLSGRAWWREWTTLAAFALGAVLVSAPLLYYIWTSPESFNRRINQIGSVAETESEVTPAYALEENVTRYALMWNVVGERNARHHVPLVPLVDPFTGLLFVVGLILLVRNSRLFSSRVLLGLLGLGLVPGLLSSDAPHALRSIDVVAPTMLIAAFALAAFVIHAQRFWPAVRLPVGIGLLAASVLFNIWMYFGHTPYDSRIWDKFEYTRETAIGSYLRQSDDRSPVVLPQVIAETDVIRYLAYDMPVQSFNSGSPPALPSGTRLIIPSDATADTWNWVERAVGSAAQRQPMRPFPGTDQPTFWLLTAP